MEVSNSTDLQTNDSATSFSGETSVEAEAPNDPNKPSISLAVSLSDELANKVSGNETLFVFAKALSGPPMPLAAARMRVSDLPATVLLDESSAMMPSLTLATVEQVSVTARVSKSGQPTAQTGDLFGTIDQVDVLGNQRTLDLVITEIH